MAVEINQQDGHAGTDQSIGEAPSVEGFVAAGAVSDADGTSRSAFGRDMQRRNESVFGGDVELLHCPVGIIARQQLAFGIERGAGQAGEADLERQGEGQRGQDSPGTRTTAQSGQGQQWPAGCAAPGQAAQPSLMCQRVEQPQPEGQTVEEVFHRDYCTIAIMYDDTIAAIATPPGEGGVGMIRVSGPDALAVAAAIFRPARPGPLRSFRLRYGHVVDPSSGAVVDEALCAFMRGPRSFTCEDVVEISCHGGPLPVQTTLALALGAGARLAQPGEFTLRAFLNGRIDLTQAEASLDVVRAQTSAGLALAQAQLGGWLAREVRAARAGLMECLAYLTAVVDFPEDEVAAQDIGPQLRAGLISVEELLAGADQGIIYRQGARVALVGRPNVGKSSLLNALLRTDRAIVTPIPGTTRDTLEETANLAGIPVVLIDTAGIHTSDDLVEQMGVERAHQALEGADLALLVLDATEPIGPGDLAIAALAQEKPTIVVWNKAEGNAPSPPAPLPFRERGEKAAWSAISIIATSAIAGSGIEELAQAVARALLGGAPPAAGDARLVSNPRHRDALQRAVDHLRAAVASWDAGRPADLLAGDLTVALNALGEITGETVGDDLLDIIFSRFCIGK